MAAIYAAILAIAASITALAGQPAAPPAPPPDTDIHELTFDGTLADLARATPRPVATMRGYENQPAYTPDGGTILFTANRDGKQTDIHAFDRATRQSRALTKTSEGEYSATPTPDESGFSVIRVEADGTQRLWRFDRDGGNPRLVLAGIKPVGYHAWADADRLVLFVLGKPATLHVARVSTGTSDVIAADVGRSLQPIPGRKATSFVQREADGRYWVKSVDAATRTVRPIVRAAPESESRDCAWLPDGTLLMSAGTRILAHVPTAARIGTDRPAPDDWRPVFDAAPHGLGAVTRMAVAPGGRALAIVVSER